MLYYVGILITQLSFSVVFSSLELKIRRDEGILKRGNNDFGAFYMYSANFDHLSPAVSIMNYRHYRGYLKYVPFLIFIFFIA
jgi:hypothetical protein